MKSTVKSIMISCLILVKYVEFNGIPKRTWKAPEKWKAQLFMKSAGAFHEKHNCSWKVQVLSMKSATVHEKHRFSKDHLQGIVTLCLEPLHERSGLGLVVRLPRFPHQLENLENQEKWGAFSSQGKVGEFLADWKGEEIYTKYWNFGKFLLLCIFFYLNFIQFLI